MADGRRTTGGEAACRPNPVSRPAAPAGSGRRTGQTSRTDGPPNGRSHRSRLSPITRCPPLRPTAVGPPPFGRGAAAARTAGHRIHRPAGGALRAVVRRRRPRRPGGTGPAPGRRHPHRRYRARRRRGHGRDARHGRRGTPPGVGGSGPMTARPAGPAPRSAGDRTPPGTGTGGRRPTAPPPSPSAG